VSTILGLENFGRTRQFPVLSAEISERAGVASLAAGGGRRAAGVG